ncbi:MAG: bifunctional diaminohydroxyphosphoribosylaminopyrimidine deaminase/5-amino-6-(5-phosphoribosylamino)uracil reductase RibD [Myxococcota bacterium]
MNAATDLARMRVVLDLAKAQLGVVWPNPAVGCVIYDGDNCVGKGATQVGGRPHAEVMAVADAGSATKGATAYVSLEPCNHWGKTPPCVDALIGAGVDRVVVAIEDPDPRTNGKGVARLKSHGLSVDVGIGAELAAEVNAGFFMRIHEGRPLISGLAIGGREDPIDVQQDAIVRLLDSAGPPVIEVRTGGVRRRRWVVAPSEVAVFGGQPVAYAPGADQAAHLRSAMAAVGALGVTRVAVKTGEDLHRALQSAGLIDREST